MFTFRLPAKQFIAAFDIDAQKTFTPVCPDELPVTEGDKIVPELNAQAEFAALRVASRDAHSPYAKWIATPEHQPGSISSTDLTRKRMLFRV